jgi:hypothetical protein
MAEPDRQRNKSIGLLAVALSLMLVMGAMMFILISWLPVTPGLLTIRGKPAPFTVTPAFIQLALGVLGVIAGVLLMRGYSKAKVLLVAVAIAVVANLGYFAIDTGLRL